MEAWDAIPAIRPWGSRQGPRHSGVPDGYEVAYLLGVGYPADRPLKPIRKPNRRPFDEVVHHGHW